MSTTILVSGNDTGIGKTVACSSLARRLSLLGRTSYIKPVETGVVKPVDAQHVSMAAENAKTITLTTFREPLAPVEAAEAEGKAVNFLDLVDETRAHLEKEAFLLVEGAGGLATPIDEKGRDWLDFAEALPVDFLLLVVENRLGMLNQVRLLASRVCDLGVPYGFWLNEVHVQSEAILSANRRAIARETFSVWAEQRHGSLEPEQTHFPWENP
mgnify:CR=1 FL=1